MIPYIYMTYKSNDLQQILAQIIGKEYIPSDIHKKAEKYSKRLGEILKSKNKRVFESDFNLLANFLQNSSFSNSVSTNIYISPHQIQKNIHKRIRDITKEREENKLKKREFKQKMIEQRLAKLRNASKSDDMEKIIKIANIRKSRKLTEKQERAREFIKSMINKETGDDAGQKPKNTSGPPIKIQDLAV